LSRAVLRPASPSDYPALARIWLQGLALAGETIESLAERLFREAAHGGWAVFVAESAGVAVGMLAIIPSQKSLEQIFVEQGLRSRGVGKVMLDFAKTQMPDGFWLRTHITNTRAHRFYVREGLAHLRDEPHPAYPTEMFRIYAWTAVRSDL